MNWLNLFSKKTTIYASFLTHMAAFFRMQLSYREIFLIPVGCLGWCRQYIHLLSAAAFAELSATFPIIVATMFFFLLPDISHTSNFIFQSQYILFYWFFPFNVEIPIQHVIFSLENSIPIFYLYFTHICVFAYSLMLL